VGVRFSLADIFVVAIFNKGLRLGLNPAKYSDYEEHFNFLMEIQEIKASCPIKN